MSTSRPGDPAQITLSSTASRSRAALAAAAAAPAVGGDLATAQAQLVGRLVQRLAGAMPIPEGPAQALGSRVLVLDPPLVPGAGTAADRGAAWPEPGLLGQFLGKGHVHRAFAIDQLAANGERLPGAWMALIAADEASQRASSQHARLQQALTEDAHARLVTSAGSRLLPGYAGIAAVLPLGPNRDWHQGLRYATVWRRQDATFQDVVSQGGLAGGAAVSHQSFTALDVARSMLLIGRAYQLLHAHDMVYTDPKPANLAFSVRPRQVPAAAAAATTSPAPRRGGVPSSGQDATSAAGVHAPAPVQSLVGEVVFIDAESLQPPGYARDPTRRAVGILTPPLVAEEILRAVTLGGGVALKRAQANPANDVFHSAMIGYSLVTGEVPQMTLGKQRYQQRCDDVRRRGGLDPKEADQVFVDEFRLTRLLDGFDHEQRQLQHQVQAGRIPQAMALVLGDGLTGRITSLVEWERRTLAVGPGVDA